MKTTDKKSKEVEMCKAHFVNSYKLPEDANQYANATMSPTVNSIEDTFQFNR